jgi:hypothetical protein
MLVVFACWASLAALACNGAGCRPIPEPVTPPGPAPVPDPPGPVADAGPVATTPCGRAAAHAFALHCTTNAPLFAETCERYAELGGASAWDPDCIDRASSCSAIEQCRGGQ